MPDAFADRQAFARFMHDLDSTVGGSGFSGVPTGNFQGIFLDGSADLDALEPSGDGDAPTWLLLWELQEPDVVASYADSGRGRQYDLAFDLFADRYRAESLLSQVGPQIVTYLGALTGETWTFLTNNARPGAGLEIVGGLEGRGFFLPAFAS